MVDLQAIAERINFNNVIFVGAYVLFVIGVLFIAADSIKFAFKQMRNTIRGQYIAKKTRPYRHMERIFVAISKTGSVRNKPEIFFLATFGIYAFFFLLLRLQGNSAAQAFALSAILAAFPYAFLRVKLHSMQLKGSYEGEGFLLELINQYKMNSRNIFETLDKTIDFLDKCPNSKRALFKMTIQLKSCVVEEDYKEALDVFVYSIGTEWSKMLANNLLLAFLAGADVLMGLNDILYECATVRENIERGKQENAEAFYMMRFLAPILYVGMVIYAIKFRDFSIYKFIETQFFTPSGLRFFIMICIAGFINYVVAMFIRRPKFDI